jgi:chromatin remodeling complex protein RSC6
MAIAKKRPTKKTARKKPARKAAPKRAVRKTTAKRKPAARKKTARKTVKKVARRTTARKTVKKKAAPKRKVAKKATPKKKTTKAKRKPNPAFMKPLTPSAALGAVVGTKAIPRTEVVKKLWAYIKKNKLQDKKDGRVIVADAKLKKVFGGKAKVDMFKMTKLVSKHLK